MDSTDEILFGITIFMIFGGICICVSHVAFCRETRVVPGPSYVYQQFTNEV